MRTGTAPCSVPADVEALEAHDPSTHAPLVDADTLQAGLAPPEGEDAAGLAARTGCTLTLVPGELD